MSEIDRFEAKARLESLFSVSKESNEGAAITELAKVVLGDDAYEEMVEMVLMAMEDSGTISSEEILDGILKLHEWRLEQT